MTEEMEAMAIWESHLQNAAEKWQQGVEGSEDKYREGLAEFLGVDENEISEQVSHEWQEDVTQMSPEEFAEAINNEGADWLTGLYEGVTGREAPEEVRQVAEEVEQNAVQEGASGEELAENIRQQVQNRAEQSG